MLHVMYVCHHLQIVGSDCDDDDDGDDDGSEVMIRRIIL